MAGNAYHLTVLKNGHCLASAAWNNFLDLDFGWRLERAIPFCFSAPLPGTNTPGGRPTDGRGAARRWPLVRFSGRWLGWTAALAEPKINARLADLGATTLPLSPTDFGKLIADETEKWAKVVKFSGARPD